MTNENCYLTDISSGYTSEQTGIRSDVKNSRQLFDGELQKIPVSAVIFSSVLSIIRSNKFQGRE